MMRYFKFSEFDSPDAPGSGEKMDPEFLRMIDQARARAGIPFVISKGGGFRTPEYNAHLCRVNPRASKTSSHKKGLAADIKTPDSRSRFLILDALISVGFNRIGIASGFIHVDNDPSKPEDLVWVY